MEWRKGSGILWNGENCFLRVQLSTIFYMVYDTANSTDTRAQMSDMLVCTNSMLANDIFIVMFMILSQPTLLQPIAELTRLEATLIPLQKELDLTTIMLGTKLSLIEREDDTRSWSNFLIYFLHNDTPT
jgi:hypothetical protein